MQTKLARFGFFALSGASLVLLMLAVLAAQTPNQIHPPPPPVERAINIVVLADGFTAGQQEDFNEAAANFFKYGLLADSVFSPYTDVFSVKTIFKPVTTASASQSGLFAPAPASPTAASAGTRADASRGQHRRPSSKRPRRQPIRPTSS